MSSGVVETFAVEEKENWINFCGVSTIDEHSGRYSVTIAAANPFVFKVSMLLFSEEENATHIGHHPGYTCICEK